LLRAEAAHFAKTKDIKQNEAVIDRAATPKRLLEESVDSDQGDEEDPEAKRRRILEETRDIDADSIASDTDDSEEDR
jgi:protein CWC15